MSRLHYVGIGAALALGAAIAIVVVRLRSPSRVKYVIGPTSSMAPTIKSGDLIFVKSFREGGDLKRYDVVVFRAPLQVRPAGVWVMRVVGLPGEAVEVRTNGLVINGLLLSETDMPDVLRGRQWLTVQGADPPTNRSWQLGSREVFVVGDNLSAANDGRFWGGLSLSNITGVVEDKAKAKQFQLTLEPLLPGRTTVTVQDGQKAKVN